MKSEHSSMITEREEQSLKMYALKILCSIVKKLNLYITIDIQKSKQVRQTPEESKDDEENVTMNESTLNAAFDRLGNKEQRLDQYGVNHLRKTEI